LFKFLSFDLHHLRLRRTSPGSRQLSNQLPRFVYLRVRQIFCLTIVRHGRSLALFSMGFAKVPPHDHGRRYGMNLHYIPLFLIVLLPCKCVFFNEDFYLRSTISPLIVAHLFESPPFPLHGRLHLQDLRFSRRVFLYLPLGHQLVYSANC